MSHPALSWLKVWLVTADNFFIERTEGQNFNYMKNLNVWRGDGFSQAFYRGYQKQI